HHASHARDALGTIPDGRRPGALLDRLRDGGVAALGVACRHGGRVAAVDALGVTEVGAPPAGRVLEHAGVIEGALPLLELRIAPHRAEGVEARAGRRARGGVHRRAVVGISGGLEDLLVRLPAGIDPALDDLYPLQRRPGSSRRPGIAEREDAEARAAAVANRPDLAAHRHAAGVRSRDEVGGSAPEIRLTAAEEAQDGAGS